MRKIVKSSIGVVFNEGIYQTTSLTNSLDDEVEITDVSELSHEEWHNLRKDPRDLKKTLERFKDKKKVVKA